MNQIGKLYIKFNKLKRLYYVEIIYAILMSPKNYFASVISKLNFKVFTID